MAVGKYVITIRHFLSKPELWELRGAGVGILAYVGWRPRVEDSAW